MTPPGLLIWVPGIGLLLAEHMQWCSLDQCPWGVRRAEQGRKLEVGSQEVFQAGYEKMLDQKRVHEEEAVWSEPSVLLSMGGSGKEVYS